MRLKSGDNQNRNYGDKEECHLQSVDASTSGDPRIFLLLFILFSEVDVLPVFPYLNLLSYQIVLG